MTELIKLPKVNALGLPDFDALYGEEPKKQQKRIEDGMWEKFLGTAKGAGKLAIKPLWWVFDMINQPLYAVSNLLYAPADDKLKLAGQNLLHMATMGLMEAPGVAKRSASEWLLGEKKSDFLSWDTLARLGIDIVHDPLTYVSGIGAATKAGKFTRNAEKMAAQMFKKGIKKSARDIIEAAAKNSWDDITKAVVSTGDDILRKNWDDFAKGAKTLRINETYDDLVKLMGKGSHEKAMIAIERTYRTSAGVWDTARKLGGDSAEDFIRNTVFRNPERFAQRDIMRMGLPFMKKAVGKKTALRLSRASDAFVRNLSKIPPGKYMGKVLKSLREFRTAGRTTEAAWDLSRNLQVEYAWEVSRPVVRASEDITTLLKLSDAERSFATKLTEQFGKGARLTDDFIKKVSKEAGMDSDKIVKAIKGVTHKGTHRPGYQNILKLQQRAFNNFMKENGMAEFTKLNVQETAELLEHANKQITKNILPELNLKRNTLTKFYDTEIPKGVRNMLDNDFGVKSMKDLAKLSDDGLDTIAAVIKGDDEYREMFRELLGSVKESAVEVYGQTTQKLIKPWTKEAQALSRTDIKEMLKGMKKAVGELEETAGSYERAIKLYKSGNLKEMASKIQLTQQEMLYMPHMFTSEIMANDALVSTLNKAFHQQERFAKVAGKRTFPISYTQRAYVVNNDAYIDMFRKMSGGKLPPELEKTLGGFSVEFTADEVNRLIRSGAEGLDTWEDYLGWLQKNNPERWAILKHHNPELQGEITSRVRDLIESKNYKTINKLFDEDPTFIMKEFNNRLSTDIASEEMVHHLIRNQGRTAKELAEAGEDLSDWVAVRNVYKDLDNVLPDNIKALLNEIGPDDMLGTYRASRVMVPADTYEFMFNNLKGKYLPGVSGKLKRNVLDVYNKLRNLWVFTTLARPGFHVRNFVSGLYMNAQYGIINPLEYIHAARIQSTFDAHAKKMLSKYGDDIFRGVKEGSEEAIKKAKTITIRTPVYGEVDALDIWNWYTKKGIGLNRTESLVDVYGRVPEGTIKRMGAKGITAVKKAQSWGGNTVENNLRLTHFIHQLKKGKTFDEAARLTKLCHYDYGDLSRYDQNIRKVFPFWSWTRKTIPAQFRVMMSHPSWYAPGVHLLTEQHKRQLPDELLPEYMADMGGMEMFKDKDGQPHFFLLGNLLPIGELNKLAIHPKKIQENVLEMLVPIIKEPIQQIANYDFFREQKIQEWEGQTGEYMGFNVPVRLRHAAFNVSWLNMVSQYFWKPKPGRPAPTLPEKLMKDITGLNLKPLQVEKLKARKEYEFKMKVKDLVSNFRRTMRYGDYNNSMKVLKNLDAYEYNIDALVGREIEKAAKEGDRKKVQFLRGIQGKI